MLCRRGTGKGRSKRLHAALKFCSGRPTRLNLFSFTTNLASKSQDYDNGLHPGCHPDNFLAFSTVYIKGRDDTGVKSFDIALTWTKDDVFGGELSVGTDGSPL